MKRQKLLLAEDANAFPTDAFQTKCEVEPGRGQENANRMAERIERSPILSKRDSLQHFDSELKAPLRRESTPIMNAKTPRSPIDHDRCPPEPS